MKVLLSFNGLVRNFKDAFTYIETNVIKNNVDCSFDIILNTSTHDNQISSKWKNSKNSKNSKNVYSYGSREELEDNIFPILNNYNVIDLLYFNITNVGMPGIFFDRIIDTYKKIQKEKYDYIFFLRFDVLIKNKIEFTNFNKDTLYFFDGGNSFWFQHDKDIDYAMLGNYKTLDNFLYYSINYNYTFYGNDIIKFIIKDNIIFDILNIYEMLEFNSRWKGYEIEKKEQTVNDIMRQPNNNKIFGNDELLIWAFYCKKVLEEHFKVEIFKDFRLNLLRGKG